MCNLSHPGLPTVGAQQRCHARAGLARGPDGRLARRGTHDVAAAKRWWTKAAEWGLDDALQQLERLHAHDARILSKLDLSEIQRKFDLATFGHGEPDDDFAAELTQKAESGALDAALQFGPKDPAALDEIADAFKQRRVSEERQRRGTDPA